MIRSLRIKNIALIEDLYIEFDPSMNVLTGETGAGKSIIIDSLNLILGERADRSLIRSGCDRANVLAIVDISNIPSVKSILDEELIDYEPYELSIERVITTSGKNICRVAGSNVSLQFLNRIMKNVVDIYSQHSYTEIISVDNHIKLLDNYADNEHKSLILDVEQSYKQWRNISTNINKLRKLKQERDLQLESTKQQLNELDEAKLQEDEEDQLLQKKDALENHSKINSALNFSYHSLYSSNDSSILDKLQELMSNLSSISSYDKQYEDLSKRVQNTYYELEEIAIELRALKDSYDFNEFKYQETMDRIDLIKKIKKKYGPSFEDILKTHNALQIKLDSYVSLDENLSKLEHQYKLQLADYRAKDNILSQSRQKFAAKFEEEMLSNLRDLGMENVDFKVVFSKSEGKKVPTPLGNDIVEFYISPNLGEPLKPLVSTASGGELSRIMLSLKTIMANKNQIPCIIFDEIDTGISGRAANVVAYKLAYISRFRQSICISHLAQIACMADKHFFIEKSVENGRTVTHIEPLDETSKICEISRLVGEVENNEQIVHLHAKNMLDQAKDYKSKIIKNKTY